MSTPALPLPDDAAIPLLTERLTLPRIDFDVSLPRATPPTESREGSGPAAPPQPADPIDAGIVSAAQESAPTPPPPAPAPLSPSEADALAREVRGAVLRAVQARLPVLLEGRIREQLEPAVQALVFDLLHSVRDSLDVTLRETVAAALEAELTKLAARPPR